MTVPKILITTLLLTFYLFATSSFSFAEPIKVPAKLEVIVESLNVRDSPPWFSWKTMFTFKYAVNPPIAILKKGVVVQAGEVTIIGQGQRWVKILYENSGAVLEGWIYTGQNSNIVNIKVVENEISHIKEITETKKALKNEFLRPSIPMSFVFSSAHASDPVKVSGDQSIEPSYSAPTIEVLLFQLIYVFVFVIAFGFFYKMTNDKWLTTFGSVAVLLIFGFVSQSALVNLLAQMS